MMPTRRQTVMGLGCLPFSASRAGLPVPKQGHLAFAIMRKGNKDGEHILTFTHDGDSLTVAIAVDIAVMFGPICIYRYKHRATEQWQGASITSVTAQTNDNGTPQTMTARRESQCLIVEGTRAPRYIAPPLALPGTHWNQAMLLAPFLNTQDGRLMTPSVCLTDTETWPVESGTVRAQHFELRGDVDLDTFYELDHAWAGLSFNAKDGSVVTYQRL